ncbi:MAG TPA: aspartate--tRNA ligase, partial [Solirubrobacteraceae bacterium]
MQQPPRANAYRDAWAGDLRAEDADREVRVAGWVHRRRDHGGLIFIDLRDRSGFVQLVFHPETSGAAFGLAEALRPEHVLTAKGAVVLREQANVNANIPTGEIEVQVVEAERLATAETPPFPIDEDVELDEMLRMRNRALDLRRPAMQEALVLRHKIVQTMRRELEARDFLEIETPILTRSTPEGARDFLVPNRRDPGTWYALPQSPQLFKQLLMVAGYERYYQIARCFRDEDTRADRQAEFTQLDVEMAFVAEDDVIETHEAVMQAVFALAELGLPAPPWPRMPYAEAIARFGSDRPDLRFGLEIRDVSDQVRGAQFKIFQSVVDGGGVVRAINAGKVELSRSELEGLNEVVQRHGGKAVAWVFVEADGWRSPIAKFFDAERIAAVNGAMEAGEGDLILFVADDEKVAAGALGGLRLELGERLGLIPADRHEILWIVDFPAFEQTEDGSWTSLHHPFSAPLGDLSGDPGALSSRNYDLVLDGTELGGGSIRINDMQVQQRVFEILGMGEEEAYARFGFLLDALKHGAPPHGGIAFGLDRIVAIMAGRDSIRDVMAFP